MATVMAEQLSAPVTLHTQPTDEGQQHYRMAFQEIAAVNAPHTARHAAESHTELTVSPSPVPAETECPRHTSVNDRILRVVSGISATLAVRRHRIAETQYSTPRWRQRAYKVGSFLTSAVGITIALQAYRLTGVAAEVNFLTDSLPAPDAYSPYDEFVQEVAQTASTITEGRPHQTPDGPHFTHVAFNSSLELAPSAADLPADLSKAPEPEALGPWDKRTGDGTIWGQTVDYADKLGYGDLTERQKWQLTDTVLKKNGLSWGDARHLSSTYEPTMPTQREMLDRLEDVHATNTHTPHRTEPVVDGHNGQARDPNTGSTSTGPESSVDGNKREPVIPADNRGWFEARWDDLSRVDDEAPGWWRENWLTALTLGGVLVLGAVGQRELNRRSTVVATPASPVAAPPNTTPPEALGDPHDADGDGDVVNPPKPRESRTKKLLNQAGKLTFIAGLLAWNRRRKRNKARKAAATE